MHFHLSLLLCALGLAAVLEALPWLLCPKKMREAMLHFAALPPEQVRVAGLILLALGMLLCAVGRSFH